MIAVGEAYLMELDGLPWTLFFVEARLSSDGKDDRYQIQRFIVDHSTNGPIGGLVYLPHTAHCTYYRIDCAYWLTCILEGCWTGQRPPGDLEQVHPVQGEGDGPRPES